MKSLSAVLIINFVFIMNDLQGQVHRIENCLQLGYAKTKYEIIKDGRYTRNIIDNRITYSISNHFNLNAGYGIKYNVNNFINMRSGLFFDYYQNKQQAYGAMFTTDMRDSCWLRDSCTTVRYKLNDVLIKIPLEFNLSFFKNTLSLGIGLNYLYYITGRYQYLINESKIRDYEGSGIGRNFSEFWERSQFSWQYKLGIRLFKKYEMTIYYEKFFNPHIMVGPLLDAKVDMYGLKVAYYIEPLWKNKMQNNKEESKL